LKNNRLAETRAAEEADLPALGVRSEEIDDLDPGLEDPRDRLLLLERRRGAVDRKALLRIRDRRALVDRLAQKIEDASQRLTPVSTASMPRTSPSVDDMATQRTTSSPMWSPTSTVRWMFRSGSVIVSALLIGGSRSGSNRTSTVGPITWMIWPMFAPLAPLPAPVPFVFWGFAIFPFLCLRAST
jgi:hypothetical protein